MEKTTLLLREDFKNNILSTIYQSNLPLFCVEYVLRDILNEVHLAVNNQLRKELSEFNNNDK